MPDVRQVIIQLQPQSANNPGQVSYGYYVLEGAVLTMTDGAGRPFRRLSGDVVKKTLERGEDPDAVALRLTRTIREEIDGRGAGFNRRLTYQNRGWC